MTRGDSLKLLYNSFLSKCRGIDLNCGCPKRDVRQCGYGSQLLDDPQLVAEIMRATRARLPYDEEFTISAKIRIQLPLARTVELCRRLEAAGISHIAVHARTRDMRGSERAQIDAVGVVKAAVRVPVYANGDCRTYEEALEIARVTRADGKIGLKIITHAKLHKPNIEVKIHLLCNI